MKQYCTRTSLFLVIAVFAFTSGILIAKVRMDSTKGTVDLFSPVEAQSDTSTIQPIKTNSNETVLEKTSEYTPTTTTIAVDAQNTDNQDVNEKKPDSAPVNAKKDSFSFAILGDTQMFEEANPSGNLQKAVSSIQGQNVDIVMTEGDLIFRCGETMSCQKSYEHWKSVMSPLAPKIYEVVGNHDRKGGALADSVWQKEFSYLPSNGPVDFIKQVYSFDYQNSHFVVLDSEKPYGNGISKEQRTWLEQDLSAHPKAHTFVFFHEPAFRTSTHSEGFCLDAHPEERDMLWKILERHNVTAVFNGHEHIFTRKKIGNVYQFVVGNTDAPLIFSPDPKRSEYSYKGNFYAITTVSGRKINVSLYSVDGKLINSFDFM